MPVLLPSQQTARQLAALKMFLEQGGLTMSEPCDCGGIARHNNGGNYHDVTDFRADGGAWWIRRGSTSDYDDSQWEQVEFVAALDIIQIQAAWGYSFSAR